jgi:hypothetical protein
MWSRRFLWTGLSTGTVFALLTVAGMWLGLFASSASTGSPFWAMKEANVVRFTLPGVIIYPLCWYAFIFRHRDYSLRRATVLVVLTFATGWAIIAVTLIAAATIVFSLEFGHTMEGAILVAVTPFAYFLGTLIGAIILAIPYAVVATPMALLHRWLLLRIFASSGSPPPLPSAGPVIQPTAPI